MYHQHARPARARAWPTGPPASRHGSGAPFRSATRWSSRIIDHFLEVTPEKAAESETVVRATFDDVAARLADGRRYLVGERFTAADLTFAALAGAVLMPPEYSVPLPQPDVLPAEMAAVVRELRAHPAGAHALAMFREERRRAPVGAEPR